MVSDLDPLVTSLRPGHVESNHLHVSTNIDTAGTVGRRVDHSSVDVNTTGEF